MGDYKKRDVNAALYRDGKPVTARPKADQALIAAQHLDPEHPDYNPTGETVGPQTKAALYKVIATQQTRSSGAKVRGEQLKEQADEAAKPIYAKYLEVSKTTPKHKRIRKLALWAQQSASLNHLDARRIRRAVERLKKKDSS